MNKPERSGCCIPRDNKGAASRGNAEDSSKTASLCTGGADTIKDQGASSILEPTSVQKASAVIFDRFKIDAIDDADCTNSNRDNTGYGCENISLGVPSYTFASGWDRHVRLSDFEVSSHG